MRRTTTLTALLLGATLLAPMPGATAAGETCRGEAATIVGTGPTIVGTPGRDVIVTGTSGDTDGGEGDDLICVTAPGSNTNLVRVNAGAGNDVVDSTALNSGFYLTTILGAGSDTFIGGAGTDTVYAGTPIGSGQSDDAERDLIDTGAGGDTVFSGVAGAPNADEVRLGDDFDRANWSGTAQPDSVLDGGSDVDGLTLTGSGTAYVLDIGLQTASIDGGRQVGFSGFDFFTILSAPGERSIAAIGTAGDDQVTVESATRLDAQLSGGDDNLIVSALPLPGSTIDLGSGQDLISLLGKDRSLALDLEDETLGVDGQSVAEVTGVEDAYVIARDVRLEGDRGNNSLSWRGCNGRIEGGAGKDHLETTYDYVWETTFTCPSTKVVMSGGKGNDLIEGKLFPTKVTGGAGNDKLKGSSKDDVILGGAGRDRLEGKAGNDTLIGGSGRDQVIGSTGRDRCNAEVERTCER